MVSVFGGVSTVASLESPAPLVLAESGRPEPPQGQCECVLRGQCLCSEQPVLKSGEQPQDWPPRAGLWSTARAAGAVKGRCAGCLHSHTHSTAEILTSATGQGLSRGHGKAGEGPASARLGRGRPQSPLPTGPCRGSVPACRVLAPAPPSARLLSPLGLLLSFPWPSTDEPVCLHAASHWHLELKPHVSRRFFLPPPLCSALCKAPGALRCPRRRGDSHWVRVQPWLRNGARWSPGGRPRRPGVQLGELSSLVRTEILTLLIHSEAPAGPGFGKVCPAGVPPPPPAPPAAPTPRHVPLE